MHSSPLEVVYATAKFICGAHMCSINITIRKKSWWETSEYRCLRALLCSVRTNLQMSTSQLCAYVTEWRIIILHDLTDERALLYLLYCCNGQLSLIITVNRTVHVCVLVLLPCGCAVCAYTTCVPIYVDLC